MALAAVLLAIVTVLVGVFVLGDVVGGPGSNTKKLAATHVGVAITGVVLLLVAVVGANRGTAWMSFAALIVAGSVGIATLTLNRPPAQDGSGAPREEGHLPLPVVVIHGAAAFLTLLLVLLTAASTGALH